MIISTNNSDVYSTTMSLLCIVSMTSVFYAYIVFMVRISIVPINYYRHFSISNTLPKMFTICKITSMISSSVLKMSLHKVNSQLKFSKISWKVISQNFKQSILKRNLFFNNYMRRKKIISFKLVSPLFRSLKIYTRNFSKLSLVFGSVKLGITWTKGLKCPICLIKQRLNLIKAVLKYLIKKITKIFQNRHQK